MACSRPVPVYCDVASGPSTPCCLASHSLSCVELQLGYQLTGLCGREGKSDQLLVCRTGPATHCWWQLLPHTAVVCSSTTSNFPAARVRPTSHARCVADSPALPVMLPQLPAAVSTTASTQLWQCGRLPCATMPTGNALCIG
jgi:hypothetical protein